MVFRGPTDGPGLRRGCLMGLGKWAAGLVQRDPSREWPAGNISWLELDAWSGRLNGVPLEAPVASAQPFGPADQCSGGAGDFDLDYRALGLQVCCFEGSIVHFRVITAPAGRDTPRDRAFQVGELQLRTGGRTLQLTGGLSEKDVM